MVCILSVSSSHLYLVFLHLQEALRVPELQVNQSDLDLLEFKRTECMLKKKDTDYYFPMA